MSAISQGGPCTVQAEKVGRDAEVFRPIIEVDGERVDAGVFTTASEAALAYDLIAVKLASPNAKHLALHVSQSPRINAQLYNRSLWPTLSNVFSMHAFFAA